MLLKPGTTCEQAIKLLESLTNQGLNDVQNSVPHIVGTALADAGTTTAASARRGQGTSTFPSQPRPPHIGSSHG